MCNATRHGRVGTLVICVDSVFNLLPGCEIEERRINYDKNGDYVSDDSLTTVRTDQYGSFVFKHYVDGVDQLFILDNRNRYKDVDIGGGLNSSIAFKATTLKERKMKARLRRIRMEHYAEDVCHLHDTTWNHLKNFVLIDKQTGAKFVLDSTQNIITAIDTTGKVVWKTNPRKDNDLPIYRIKYPIILSFSLGYDSLDKEKIQMIWIRYDNSQFGVIDKKTGKFTWYGQD